MSTSTVPEFVILDGLIIKIPILKDKTPRTTKTFPLFLKSDWLPDDEVSKCMKCESLFTAFRRKHHCRCCGKIFCHGCCSEKISLSHFGMTDPEKVCLDCQDICSLIVKCLQYNTPLVMREGMEELKHLLSSDLMPKVIECGGVHILLYIASLVPHDVSVMETVSSVIHSLSQHLVLSPFLVSLGSLQVIKCILVSDLNSPASQADCLSALNLLCKNPELRIQAIKDKVVDPIAALLTSTGTIGALAAHVLVKLLSDIDSHEYILQNHQNLVTQLFRGLPVDDFQIHGAITKMLVQLSAGSEAYRDLILNAEEDQGTPLLFFLKGAPSGVLLNVVCVVSNLAINPKLKNVRSYITALCDLLHTIEFDSKDLLVQIARGIANFAEKPDNSLHVLEHLPSVISILLKSEHMEHRYHACRTIIHLMINEFAYTLGILSRDGMQEFLAVLFVLPGLTDLVNSSLLRKVSRLSMCS